MGFKDKYLFEIQARQGFAPCIYLVTVYLPYYARAYFYLFTKHGR